MRILGIKLIHNQDGFILKFDNSEYYASDIFDAMQTARVFQGDNPNINIANEYLRCAI